MTPSVARVLSPAAQASHRFMLSCMCLAMVPVCGVPIQCQNSPAALPVSSSESKVNSCNVAIGATDSDSAGVEYPLSTENFQDPASRPGDTRPASQKAADKIELSKLEYKSAKPVFDVENFKDFTDKSDYFEYPKNQATPPVPAVEPPFETDAEAVEAAKDWIVKRFGPLGSGLTLSASSIRHSSSGHDKPVYDWDKGRTIVLELVYENIPLDIRSILYNSGKTQFHGTIKIGTVKALSDTKKEIISMERAIDSCSKLVRAVLGRESDVSEFRKKASPRLEYVEETRSILDIEQKARVFRPCWVMAVAGEKARVDAYTGQAWLVR